MVLAREPLYDESIKALIVDLRDEYTFVSTLPYQPRMAKSVIFKKVSHDFNCVDLGSFYESIRRAVGREDSIVFLTSASLDNRVFEISDDGRVGVIATVGLRPPACPGMEFYESIVGTVNVAVILDYRISYNALVDLLRVVAEAKALASVDLLLRCKLRSPGTVTDAIAVGGRVSDSNSMIFSGMATRVGSWVSRVVYERLVELGLKILGPEGLIENALGLTMEDMVELVVKAYLKAPVPGVSVDHVRLKAGEILGKLVRDPNVLGLIIASRELDLHAIAGSIPGLTREAHVSDSPVIVLDELLAFSLSLYIAGFKGLLAAYWVERLKEGKSIDINLPQFEDDIVSSLVGSILSLLYTELLGAQ